MAGSQYCIFDLNGTVVDSLPHTASIDSAFADCGIRTPACNVGQFIAPPIRQILARVAGASNAAFLDRLEHPFHRSYDSEGWRKTTCFERIAQHLTQRYGCPRLSVI